MRKEDMMLVLKILLITLAVIAGLLIFLLFLRAKVTIDYREELALTVTVLGIPFRILPTKEKKVKANRYSVRKMRRLERRAAEKKKKNAPKEKRKAELKAKQKAQRKAAAKNKPKAPLDQTLKMILELLKIFFVRFGHHLHIHLTRLRITVATGDAAKTAILWGAVCPTVGAILELLDRGTNLHTRPDSDIDVRADFVGEKITADICIAFSLRVWNLFDIGIRLLFGYLKHKPAIPSA